MSAIATAWERFWFAPSDPFVLSVLRWLEVPIAPYAVRGGS